MRGDEIRDKGDEDINLEDIPETDFTNGVRGLHYTPPRGVTLAHLDADVAACFLNDDEVNDALRMLIAEGRAPVRSGR